MFPDSINLKKSWSETLPTDKDDWNDNFLRLDEWVSEEEGENPDYASRFLLYQENASEETEIFLYKVLW